MGATRKSEVPVSPEPFPRLTHRPRNKDYRSAGAKLGLVSVGYASNQPELCTLCPYGGCYKLFSSLLGRCVGSCLPPAPRKRLIVQHESSPGP